MCQKQKNKNKKSRFDLASVCKDVGTVSKICIIALLFVLILNFLWYAAEHFCEEGLPSSLTYSEGFQLAINVIFMCIIAFLQYRVEKTWNDVNDEKQKFEKELEFRGIISDRIHRLSEPNQLSVVGHISVPQSLQDDNLTAHYPKSIQHIIDDTTYDLLICIEALGQLSIFPACYQFDDLTLQCFDLSIKKENVKYNNASLVFGINASECTDVVKEKIFSSLVSTLYYNQKGRQLEDIDFCLTAKVTDTSHPAYDMKKQQFTNGSLSFKLKINFSLLPASGFYDVFGKFKMLIKLKNVEILSA